MSNRNVLMPTSCPPENGICNLLQCNYATCVKFSRDHNIKVTEKGKSFSLENPSGRCVARVKVDGCVITSNEMKKADFLIVDCDKNTAYLVECKGTHVDHACEQIIDTINILRDVFGLAHSLNACIVCRRGPTPRIISSFQKKLDKICRKKGGKLKIESVVMKERLV